MIHMTTDGRTCRRLQALLGRMRTCLKLIGLPVFERPIILVRKWQLLFHVICLSVLHLHQSGVSWQLQMHCEWVPHSSDPYALRLYKEEYSWSPSDKQNFMKTEEFCKDWGVLYYQPLLVAPTCPAALCCSQLLHSSRILKLRILVRTVFRLTVYKQCIKTPAISRDENNVADLE